MRDSGESRSLDEVKRNPGTPDSASLHPGYALRELFVWHSRPPLFSPPKQGR